MIFSRFAESPFDWPGLFQMTPPDLTNGRMMVRARAAAQGVVLDENGSVQATLATNLTVDPTKFLSALRDGSFSVDVVSKILFNESVKMAKFYVQCAASAYAAGDTRTAQRQADKAQAIADASGDATLAALAQKAQNAAQGVGSSDSSCCTPCTAVVAVVASDASQPQGTETKMATGSGWLGGAVAGGAAGVLVGGPVGAVIGAVGGGYLASRKPAAAAAPAVPVVGTSADGKVAVAADGSMLVPPAGVTAVSSESAPLVSASADIVPGPVMASPQTIQQPIQMSGLLPTTTMGWLLLSGAAAAAYFYRKPLMKALGFGR
jgi:hypothetical protein